MKNIFYILAVFFAINSGVAQTRETSDKFDFDKNELDPQFVLRDNYNHFMLSVLNTDGMMASRKMIIRKFDQKNQLVDTFIHDFPKFDIATLYNYLGFSETDGKVAIFIQEYSNKAKKSEIVKIEFDKASSKFTDNVISSDPIASAMKSGTVRLQKSENSNYIAIVYTKHRAKGEAEKNVAILVNRKALDVAWKKDVEFANEHVTQNITVTNSGKIVLMRESSGFKKSSNNNYLVVVGADGQEDKNFETAIFLQQPRAISIGAQDYIIAFNSESSGKYTKFTHILFYDLTAGRILQNNKIGEYGMKDLQDVTFRNIFLENNEIHLFAEGKIEAGTKPSTNGFSSTSFPEPVYKFGPSYLYILSFEGALKTTKQLPVTNTLADRYHSFGLLQVKGSYYVNTGNFSGFFKLGANYAKEHVVSFPDYTDATITYINQLMTYFPDSGKLLFARTTADNKMQLELISGVKL